MKFKRKKKAKVSDQQLLLFSTDEMSGKESLSSPSSMAVDEEVVVDVVDEEKDDKAGESLSITSPDSSEEEIKGTPLIEEFINDDPFSPFIDDPANTSARIIHEMTAAMTLLDRFDVSQVRLIAMQAAPIVQSGVDYSKIYQLPSLPGFSMSGFSMLALSYVSFKRVFPSMIDRLDQDFTHEYETALSQHKSAR